MATKYGAKSQNDEDISIKSFKYDLKGMPANYPRDKVADVNCAVVVKKVTNATREHGGVYMSKKHAIVIFPHNLGLHKIKTSKELRLFEKQIIQIVEHELMHSVQSKLLGDEFGDVVAKQIFPKASDDEIYFLLPHEFDPQIISSAFRFYNKLISLYNLSDNDVIREEFDKFIGASKNAIMTRDPFFEALKRHDNERWKLAVKKFTQLLKQKYQIKIHN